MLYYHKLTVNIILIINHSGKTLASKSPIMFPAGVYLQHTYTSDTPHPIFVDPFQTT